MANTLTEAQFLALLNKPVGSIKPGDLEDVLLTLSRRKVVRSQDYNRGTESTTARAYKSLVPKIVSVGFNKSSYASSGDTLDVTFTFDQNITISGSPRVLLKDTGVSLIQATKTTGAANTLKCEASIDSSDSGTLSFSGGPNQAFVTVSSFYTFKMKSTGVGAAAAGNGWTILVARKRVLGTPSISQTINSTIDATAKTIVIYVSTDGSGDTTTTITQLGTFISGNGPLNALIAYTAIGTGTTACDDMDATPVVFANGYDAWVNYIDLNGGSIVAATGGATAFLTFSAPTTMPTIT